MASNIMHHHQIHHPLCSHREQIEPLLGLAHRFHFHLPPDSGPLFRTHTGCKCKIHFPVRRPDAICPVSAHSHRFTVTGYATMAEICSFRSNRDPSFVDTRWAHTLPGRKHTNYAPFPGKCGSAVVGHAGQHNNVRVCARSGARDFVWLLFGLECLVRFCCGFMALKFAFFQRYING